MKALNFRFHRISNQVANEEYYLCSLCLKHCSTSTRMYRHLKRHEETVKEEKKFNCHNCNQKFDQFQLEMHFLECQQENSNVNHEVIGDFCEVNCDGEVKEAKDVSEKQSGIKCPVCGKSEKTREDMERHIKNHPLESLMAAVT